MFCPWPAAKGSVVRPYEHDSSIPVRRDAPPLSHRSGSRRRPSGADFLPHAVPTTLEVVVRRARIGLRYVHRLVTVVASLVSSDGASDERLVVREFRLGPCRCSCDRAVVAGHTLGSGAAKA